MVTFTGNNTKVKVFLVLAGFCFMAIFLRLGVAFAHEQHSEVAGSASGKFRRLGERIYRDGILPSGEPLKAVVNGDIDVEGTQFSCSSCHMRSGLGSYEGQVVTLPTNGIKLYQPSYSGGLSELSQTEWEKVPKQFRFSILRPAYTHESLANAILGGVDSGGRILDAIMPRYQLEEKDMSILISYLKELSSTPSPGVTETTLLLFQGVVSRRRNGTIYRICLIRNRIRLSCR